VDAVRDGRAELRGDAARHLTRVLRAKAGQLYEISDHRAAYLAEIVEANPECAVFRVVEALAMPPEPLLRVTLCAALIKFDRFEWIVEKATELGVERIVPVETALSEKGLRPASGKRAARWERIARESSQQSRRLQAPLVQTAVRFEEALATVSDYRYFLDEAGAPSLHGMLPEDRTKPAEAALLIGPEGGWTNAERQAAATAGWRAAGLGPRILRAETAAVAALAVLLAAWTA
jgi:16S rRNA (uracil1498-N3)-methyltransferase